MNTYSIQNPELQLTIHRGENRLEAQLTVKSTQSATPRVPLIILEVRDRMQERSDRIDRYDSIHCEHGGENILHVTVCDTFRKITVGLWLRMDAKGLSVLLQPAEVEEAESGLYRLFAAEILPGLLKAGPEDQVLMPLASGVIFHPAGKPAISDRFLIYGEQERWELLPTMPLCGMQSERGGWLALAVQGASDMYCSVATDGEGNATIGLHPMLRTQWIDPVDWSQREIRIERIAPALELAKAAGLRLHDHVRDDLKKPTLAERAEASPECAYQQTAYTMKLFHGIQQQGIMMNGRKLSSNELLFKRTLRFCDAASCFHRLKDAGIDHIYFQSVGWNPRGHDGGWPTDFPIDQRLGGESGFRNMVETARSLGFHITTHLNTVMACFASPDYRPDWVVHDIWGEPKVTGVWGGGPHANHWGLAVPEHVIRQRFERLKRFGFNGMQYIDFMGNPLCINYHPVHRGSRAGYAEGINRFLAIAREYFGGVQTEMGYLYCALETDAFVTPGTAWHLGGAKAEWPITPLIERIVPVWHLALHDFVTLENHGLDWPETMRAVLFGAVPRDEWSMEGDVFPILDDDRIAKLKARYDVCCRQFGHLVTQQLTSWRQLDGQVEETTFADGTVVLADFASEHLCVNGKLVPTPPALRTPICSTLQIHG